MDTVLKFFRDFGNLLNAALILSLFGVAVKIFSSIIGQKNAQIDVLKDRIALIKDFSIESVTERFRALKEWYEESQITLEKQLHEAKESTEKEFQKRIELEMQKRKILMDEYKKLKEKFSVPTIQVSHSQVCGKYSVTGYNPDIPNMTYFGDLYIEEHDKIFNVRWEIGPKKKRHIGIGLLKSNVFSVTFKYNHPPFGERNGIILYEFVSEEVMRGSWTGEGTSKIGFEECRKKDTEKVLD